MGVNLHLGTKVEEIEGGDRVKRVLTSNGELDTDMVLLSIGIRPVSKLAEKAGAELGAKGAIKVDEHMRTSLPDVLACGDCAVTHHLISGRESWIPLGSTARKQARVAAETAAGNEATFPGVQGTFILKAFEKAAGKTGLSLDEAVEAGFDAEIVSLEDSSLPRYYKGGGKMSIRIIVEKPSGRVLGAQLVGDYTANIDKRLDVLAVAVKAGLTATDLTSLDLAYAPPFSTALDLPIVAGYLAEAKVLGKTCFCTVEGLED
jgi:NADPH-dependent 2,4-dienoyl-CoA reductase/sulfur reductase-like enzyme